MINQIFKTIHYWCEEYYVILRLVSKRKTDMSKTTMDKSLKNCELGQLYEKDIGKIKKISDSRKHFDQKPKS